MDSSKLKLDDSGEIPSSENAQSANLVELQKETLASQDAKVENEVPVKAVQEAKGREPFLLTESNYGQENKENNPVVRKKVVQLNSRAFERQLQNLEAEQMKFRPSWAEKVADKNNQCDTNNKRSNNDDHEGDNSNDPTKVCDNIQEEDSKQPVTNEDRLEFDSEDFPSIGKKQPLKNSNNASSSAPDKKDDPMLPTISSDDSVATLTDEQQSESVTTRLHEENHEEPTGEKRENLKSLNDNEDAKNGDENEGGATGENPGGLIWKLPPESTGKKNKKKKKKKNGKDNQD